MNTQFDALNGRVDAQLKVYLNRVSDKIALDFEKSLKPAVTAAPNETSSIKQVRQDLLADVINQSGAGVIRQNVYYVTHNWLTVFAISSISVATFCLLAGSLTYCVTSLATAGGCVYLRDRVSKLIDSEFIAHDLANVGINITKTTVVYAVKGANLFSNWWSGKDAVDKEAVELADKIDVDLGGAPFCFNLFKRVASVAVIGSVLCGAVKAQEKQPVKVTGSILTKGFIALLGLQSFLQDPLVHEHIKKQITRAT